MRSAAQMYIILDDKETDSRKDTDIADKRKDIKDIKDYIQIVQQIADRMYI